MSAENNLQNRRALNMVWNAAGRYGFSPPFLAFYPDGDADFYWNTVIGLTEKYVDGEALATLFSSYAGTRRAEEFDGLVWLALENYVFEREQPERPILRAMREEAARRFFQERETLSRQQMMAVSPRLYEQREARFAYVLGKKLPFLSPAGKKLEEDLRLPGSLQADKVPDRLKLILAEDLHFQNFKLGENRAGRPVSPFLSQILKGVLRTESRQVDSLIIRTGAKEAGNAPGAEGFRQHHLTSRQEGDEAFIREVFGPCMYGDGQMRRLEAELCRGNHEECRLWITREKDFSGALGREAARRALSDAEKQQGKNRQFYEASGQRAEAVIRSLAAQFQTLLSSYARPLPEKARTGKLNARLAYRMAVCQDPMVFLRPGEETEYDLTVDLLLDASASRAENQEMIAAQAFMLSESLVRCHIPVQVTAFRSLRGFTVLQVLKSYEEEKSDRIFRYYAGGWNRDGLAIRAARQQMKPRAESSLRLLFVLTDANPDDSVKLPPEEGSFFLREYGGPGGIEDTEEAVAELKEEKIRVAAIYLGPTTHLKNVERIYGEEYVRISRIEQLADGARRLLERVLINR
ncbi:MAG: hypothetical protein IJ773_01690 [Lachnospiraceae bacterium]|nr:hypothetical protein [Lachnospiraceae bacterium]